MIKVVHVITGLNYGGAETALYRLLKGQENRSRFHVISLTDEGVFAKRMRDLGVEVTALGARSGVLALAVVFPLMRLIQRIGPEIVQTWMYHADLLGGIASRLAGVPVCWGIRHGNLAKSQNKRSTLAVVKVCALLSSLLPARIISCSFRAADLHRRAGYADRFVVIPNGIDITVGDSCASRLLTRQALGCDSEALIVGHVGRNDFQKDHPTLMATFAKLLLRCPKARLLLIGSELHSGSAYLEKLLAGYDFGDRLIALGPREDAFRLMPAMDVFVLSSVGEGFPNVVAEAMACGVPCVVTDVGDAAAIVGKTGWVRDVGDADGLCTDLETALGESVSSRKERGRAARQRILENFSLDRMVSGYESAWGEAMGLQSDIQRRQT